MSVLGPGSLGRIPLASSVAAGAQKPANLDEVQALREAARAQADEVQLTAHTLGEAEALESETSEQQIADRDPDGRLPWTARRGAPHPDGEEESSADRGRHPPPPPGEERGQTLDLDA